MDNQLVLVDVGASGEPPKIWKQIGSSSTYVGFDPDEREMIEVHSDFFKRHIIINKAVMPNAGHVKFYLTQSPYCSSTLPPDLTSLQDYIYSDLFVVTSEATVSATTLDDAIAVHDLKQIDWLKTDSQGIDLQIYKSMSDQLRNKVMALDVEPGLLHAYQGEDLFPAVHMELLNNGFWLSGLQTEGTIRMKRKTMHDLNLQEDTIIKASKMAPGWLEARYLRTLDWLETHEMSRREYMVLFVFSVMQRHYGYALDILQQYQDLFGEDPILKQAQVDTVALIHQLAQDDRNKSSLARRIKNRIRRVLS
ncbi:MAG: FkbM family methyltransferase [Phototrophicaceae bacterium]